MQGALTVKRKATEEFEMGGSMSGRQVIAGTTRGPAEREVPGPGQESVLPIL